MIRPPKKYKEVKKVLNIELTEANYLCAGGATVWTAPALDSFSCCLRRVFSCSIASNCKKQVEHLLYVIY